VIASPKLIFPAQRLDGDGFAAWHEVERRGHEGLVAKDNASRYIGGRFGMRGCSSSSALMCRRQGRALCC
jgi:hypothetical protein